MVDPDVLTLDPLETLQCLRKGRHKRSRDRVVLGVRHQHADTANPRGLLGVPDERPCRHPAKNGEERASLHVPVLELAAAIGLVETPRILRRRLLPGLAAAAQRAGEICRPLFVEGAAAFLAIGSRLDQ